jgi:hypothetical protein
MKNTWLELETLCERLSVLLVSRSNALIEAAEFPADAEQAIDVWIRKFLKQPAKLVFPVDPVQRGALLARLLCVKGHSMQHIAFASPPLKIPVEELAELSLIDMWYTHFRALWLSHPVRIDPRKN